VVVVVVVVVAVVVIVLVVTAEKVSVVPVIRSVGLHSAQRTGQK
jgi:hypothetical protein